MPTTMPDQAKLNWFRVWAASLLNGTAVRLFQNDVTITPATALGDLVESTFPGYGPQAPPGWSAGALNAEGLVVSVTADLAWTRGAGGLAQTIYGAYLTYNDAGFNRLLWVERNTIPFAMDAAGKTYRRRVFLTLQGE